METTLGTKTDFSEIAQMDTQSKIRILEYLVGRVEAEELSEAEAVMATKILSERLTNPGFIPEELKPSNWKKYRSECN